MEAFETWWRNTLIAVLGPCFLVSAAVSFHYDQSAAPVLAGIASTLANARAAAQPLLLLPALLREHGDGLRL